MAAESADGAGDLEVEVTAYQWNWQFTYPEANVTTENRLVIPAGTDVRLTLQSEDVIHAIYIPELGVKQNIMPGQDQIARTHATETGEHQLYCAKLCGSGHSRMHGTVVVVNQTEYDLWLTNQSNAN